jgi:hypothetical protein
MTEKHEDSFTKAWKEIFINPWIPVLWALFTIGIVVGAFIVLILMLIF